jgi:hypothetical protein
MDRTRRIFGHDKAQKNKKAVTYRHYVISPDPKDHVDLKNMREFAVDWVKEFFGDYEAAIVYHDDNANGILHAHIVINVTNMITGSKLQISSNFMNSYTSGLQKMAEDRGWGRFSTAKPEEEPKGFRTTTFTKDGKIKEPERAQKPKSFNNRAQEKAKQANGNYYSWKNDLEERVRSALAISTNQESFIENLAAMNVSVAIATGAKTKGDFQFAFADDPSKCCNGMNLAGDKSGRYGKLAVLNELFGHAVDKALAGSPEYISNVIETLQRFKAGEGVQRITLNNFGTYSLQDVADTLDIHTEYHITSLKDYDALIVNITDADERGALLKSRNFVKETGMFQGVNARVMSSYVHPRPSPKRAAETITEDERVANLWSMLKHERGRGNIKKGKGGTGFAGVDDATHDRHMQVPQARTQSRKVRSR